MKSEKKKILYIITKSNFGGAQRYVYDLATNMPKSRYDISVALGGDGLLSQKLKDAKIEVINIPRLERDFNLFNDVFWSSFCNTSASYFSRFFYGFTNNCHIF